MADESITSGIAPCDMFWEDEVGYYLMSSSRHKWQDDAACLDAGVDFFFDAYEDDTEPYKVRHAVDSLCRDCPVMRTCFAYAKFYELTGVWGGVYMTDGKMDYELNDHKTPNDWALTYTALTK